jgi:multidrug efflux pump
MNITRAAISNNRVTAVVLIVVLLAGYQAFMTLPRSEDPGFIIRTAQVMTIFPGASPERVEKLVTDKLEKAVQEIPQLDVVLSTSRTGISVVFVNIKESEKKMRPIWDSLRRKIDSAAKELPAGCRKPVVNDEFGDVFGIVLGLTGDGYTYAQLKTIADEIRDELLRLPDAAKVEIYGAQSERIFIEYNNTRLAEVGLSVGQLQGLLESQNIVIPGGSVLLDRFRIAIEPSGNFENVTQIENTVIPIGQKGRVVYLKDIANVSRGYIDPPKEKAHTSSGTALLYRKREQFKLQRPATAALVIGISMREGGKLTDLGEQVEKALARINGAYPHGIKIEKILFQPKDVQDVINGFTESLLQAVVIVMAAMLLFLGLRTGLVVSALIPTAIMATLMVMQLFGIGLNQISLAALIIALGMLVDNGVVMAESTMVQMSRGQTATEAAIASAKELRIPLLTSSLTTAAAFLPIYLAKSATGEYTAALFQVVTIALLCSWLLSLTMTPMLCAWLLRPSKRSKPVDYQNSRFYRGYRGFLMLFLRRPWLTVVVITAVFFGGMSLFRFVPAIFFPPSDRPTFEIQMSFQTGTDIETTRRAVEKVEEHLHKQMRPKTLGGTLEHGVTKWASFIGAGGPRYYLGYNPEPPTPGYAIIFATHTDREHMDATLAKLRRFCEDKLPEVQATISPRKLGPPVKHPVEIRLSGRNTSKLFSIVEKLKAKLRTFPKAINVADNWGLRTRKLVVKIDQARARRAGVTSQDVALSLQTLFSGLEVTQYREGDKVIPVVMRSEAADRQDIGKLETHRVYAQSSGRSVPLEQIASIELSWEPSKILRRNRLRTVNVSAGLAPGGLASAINKKLAPWLAQQQKSWPLGYRYEIAGENESSEKANSAPGEAWGGETMR